MNQHSNHIRTGTYVDAVGKDVPGWCVVDGIDGNVITFANTRSMAREFASHEHGERIARVHSVTYSVSK